MKKTLLQLGAGIILFGSGALLAGAFSVQRADLQNNNQVQMQFQNNGPELHFNPGGGQLGQAAVNHRAEVRIKVKKLISAIEKTSKRVEKTKYFSRKDRKELMKTIEEGRRVAEKIKNDGEGEPNFDQAMKTQYMSKIEILFNDLRQEISKAIMKKQLENGNVVVNKFGVVSDKVWIYTGIAKKQGINVDDVEEKLAKSGKKLAEALTLLADAKKITEKIQPGIDIATTKEYLKDAHKKIKLAYENISEAKILLKESIGELKKVVKVN